MSCSLFPKGSKSFSPFVTRYNWRNKRRFYESFNRILIESLIGIKNAENLINNKEVDFIYFGAYDLSLEINQPGKIFSSKIISYLRQVIKFAKNTVKRLFQFIEIKKN